MNGGTMLQDRLFAMACGSVLAVAIFVAGLRVGLALGAVNTRVAAANAAALTSLVASSRCIWMAPNDSLREHPYKPH